MIIVSVPCLLGICSGIRLGPAPVNHGGTALLHPPSFRARILSPTPAPASAPAPVSTSASGYLVHDAHRFLDRPAQIFHHRRIRLPPAAQDIEQVRIADLHAGLALNLDMQGFDRAPVPPRLQLRDDLVSGPVDGGCHAGTVHRPAIRVKINFDLSLNKRVRTDTVSIWLTHT